MYVRPPIDVFTSFVPHYYVKWSNGFRMSTGCNIVLLPYGGIILLIPMECYCATKILDYGVLRSATIVDWVATES